MHSRSFNSVKTALLLGTLTGFFLLCGKMLGGETGVFVGFCIVAVLNFIAYWFADKIVLAIYRAKLVPPSEYPVLYSALAYLTERANIPIPKLYFITHDMPTAFSIGRTPDQAAVVVTSGLLELLNKEELAGVIAHEISHIMYCDTLVSGIAAGIGGIISVLAHGLQSIIIFGWGRKPRSENFDQISQFFMSMVAPVLAIFIQLAVSRARDFAADETSAQLCGDPLWLSNALRKLDQATRNHTFDIADQHPATAHLFIVNPLHHKKWRQMFSTHPSTAERVRRLQGMVA